jgi:hypothetical protein
MLILDLKTVPDPAAGKRLLALERFSDAEAELAMKTLRVAAAQTATVPLQQRRVVAAALLQASPGHFAITAWHAGQDEAGLLAGLEALASAPVWAWDSGQGYRTLLLARALATGVPMPKLLADQGPQSLAAQFGLQPACASLAELAAVHRLPHRLGLRAADAEAAHARGDATRLTTGSEADVLIAYLLAMGLKAATGEIAVAEAEAARQAVRRWLATQTAAHWQQFASEWRT